MNNYKLNTKYKDRLFRLIFHEKKELLELYNAVNESHYTNPDDLEIRTIEDVVYMGMRNDLSFIIGDEMNLYEHQSTFSPNLPLRGLFYFSSVYKAYIEPVKHKLYSDSKLQIPFPQYIIFYNGIEEKPERQELKLSTLFVGNGKGKNPALECTVDECIRKDILADVLRRNRSEIVDNILTEWDENEYRDFLKKESLEDGIKIGEARGEKRGEKRGIVGGTIRTCKDFQLTMEETLSKIIKDFSLGEEEAKQYMEEYWK